MNCNSLHQGQLKNNVKFLHKYLGTPCPYRTAIHLITGHYGLNKHLYKMKKTDSCECPICGHEEESVSHFLGQCPAIAQLRGQYFNDYYLSVNDIFDDNLIFNIIKFANHTQRFLEPEALDLSGVT